LIRSARSLAAAALVALVVASIGVQANRPAVATGRPLPENVNVSAVSGNQSEQAVAVNPADPKNIVIISNLDTGGGLFKGVTRDGGKTWAREVIAEGDHLGFACCDPSLSWDRFGNLFFTYLDYDNFLTKVPVALSTDGGDTFTKITQIDNPNKKASPDIFAKAAPPIRSRFPLVDQPTITTGAGSVWVSFNGFGPMYASGARVRGLGRVGRFQPARQLPQSNNGNFGDIAIGQDGQVAVVWQRPSSGEGPSTVFESLNPGGLAGHFTPPRALVVTNVGGFDYIPAQPFRSVDAEAGLAWDRSFGPHRGRLYLIYCRESPDESNNLDVMSRFSDDGGLTWSKPRRVNDDDTHNSQPLPRISLDQSSGWIVVSWYDARNDEGDRGPGDTDGRRNDDVQFFGAFSLNGGRSFGRNFPIAEGPTNARPAFNGIDLGDYTGLDFSQGVAHPSWADNSNTTRDNPDGRLHELDIYTASVPVFP
jgi:hypothetical protein